jgi:long-chain acyl-CoA synthetase
MSNKCTLFSRWLHTLESRRNDAAVIDLQTGEVWSFAEIETLLADKPSYDAPIIAQSSGIELIIKTLWAWREKVPLFPLEPNVSFALEDLKGLPEDVAHIKHTSGTTGTPRLVLFSDGQLQADADQIVASMGLGQYEGNIGVISAVHSYGFSNLVLPLLLYGIPLLMCESPLPENLRRTLLKVKGSVILPAVPAMWNAWEKSGVLVNAPVGLAISAGAPLSLELEKRIFSSCGIKVHNFYGSSECGGISYDDSNEVRQSSNIAGNPIRGVELEVTADGRLLVKSAAAGIGYWPISLPEEIGNGRFLTGDLAEINPVSKQLRLIGRMSEAINVAGRKLPPFEVEQALMSISSIDCCVVFGVPSKDADRVEDIVACYRASVEIDEEQLQSTLKKHLQAWQLPRIYWNNNELTTSNLGKVSRSYWRQIYLSLTDRGGRPE